MKKTLISVLILTALFTTTGCEDKEAKATIEQQTQTIAQLTAENTQLRAEKEKAEKIETAKQHKAIDDNVDNTAVTLNDNQSDDSNN